MANRLTFSRSAVRENGLKRRGFGLFSDDEGDYSEVERFPVSFSGNKSGFEALGKGVNGVDREDPPAVLSSAGPSHRNSRNSLLVTPQRARSSHRSTPYSTTTSRALLRAKTSKEASIDQENQLISSEAVYETTPLASKYTMRGAKESPQVNGQGDGREEQEERGVEKGKGDGDFKVTPSRNIFSRTATPSKTTAVSPVGERSVPNTGKKTWGQWLGAILPASVKKPVSAILGAPSETVTTLQVRSPRNVAQAADDEEGEGEEEEEEEEEEEGYSLPGSFSRAAPSPMRTPSRKPPQGEVNNHEILYELPSRGGFSDHEKSKLTPSSRGLAPLSKMGKQSSGSFGKTPARSGASPATPGSSYHRTSNFIERMRSAKKSHRYDPYARPIGRTPQRKSMPQTEDEDRELTAEEELELLKQRERDRKVQEAEDRYLRREIRRKLGQEDVDEEGDSDMSEEDTPTSSFKATVEDVSDHETEPIEESVGSPPPLPQSPAKQKPQDPSTPAGPLPVYLFGLSPVPVPAPSSSSPPPSPSQASPVEPANTAPAAASWSFSSDSDKENISSGPPPPPTMSHAQLPAPLTPSSQPPAITGGLFSTALQQPAGGFGLGFGHSTSPTKEPSAVGRQRSQAEKFKPLVSSGLRESSTVDEEKENDIDMDIENQKPGENKKLMEKEKPSQTPALQQNASRPFGALKENAGVVNVGKSEGKVDVRAKIEALTNKQLGCGILWPTTAMPESFTKDVRNAVESMFSTTGRDPGEYPQGIGSEMFGLAVKVDVV